VAKNVFEKKGKELILPRIGDKVNLYNDNQNQKISR